MQAAFCLGRQQNRKPLVPCPLSLVPLRGCSAGDSIKACYQIGSANIPCGREVFLRINTLTALSLIMHPIFCGLTASHVQAEVGLLYNWLVRALRRGVRVGLHSRWHGCGQPRSAEAQDRG